MPRFPVLPFLVSLSLTAAAEPPMLREAPKLFAEFCAGCHGADLGGGKAASLLDDRWAHGGDNESLERTIREGVPLSGMPAFGKTLSAAEIRALIVFIQESKTRAVSPELRGSHPLPAGIQRSERQKYRIETVVEGFDVPWSFAFLSEGRLLVVERPGRLRVVENGRLHPDPIHGTPPVWAHDEGGLFSVVLHPAYAQNGWIYLSFSDPGEKNTAMTKIVRGRIRGHRWVDEQTIFSMPREHYRESGMGFGGRLLFSGEYLFFSVGERGTVGSAQDLRVPEGKLHRVRDDGTTPDDNPFARTPGAFPSIWSYGHRNPQGLASDPATGELWETEHGPRGGDELNHIQEARNYGWPIVTYGMNYDGTPVSPLTEKEGLEPPVLHWTPSIATCPILVYRGRRYPAWDGHLFLGSLAQQEFLRFEVRQGRIVHQERVFKNLGRVRDLQVSPDGLIHLSLEIPGGGGRVIRLLPES